MKCWTCGETASGVCAFCGRGVCVEHHKESVSIVTVFPDKEQVPQVVVVADALNCGHCHPAPEPIAMPEFS